MSRSETEMPIHEPAIVDDPRRLVRPRPPIERAFRWLADYRNQTIFEYVPDRVTA
jgi:hypothetical protein